MTRGLLALALLCAAPLTAQEGAHPPVPSADIEAMLTNGRFQEAAWAVRAAGDTARADSLFARLESILQSPPVHFQPLAMDSQGVSFTYRLVHETGVASLFKVDGSDIFCPACGASREVAVYRIDRLLGIDLTPVTVFQHIVDRGDTLRGSAMYWMQDAVRPEPGSRAKPDRLRFLDAVVGNSDRHAANWLVGADGTVIAIDHNRAFDYRPETRPKTCWEAEIDSLVAPGALGPPFQRYRDLPADSLEAAVAGVLEPALAQRFVAMRARVVERIEKRAAAPDRRLPRTACPWES